ncbi:uncharacterized protein LOC141590147 [Silene latifolia]|uniref:uncharacterized protein LOC141590147 n=1 Tax=Silene latifolia TaxID=37657 RepID=UPI003D77DB9C
MADIKGISPTLCMHQILLKDEAKLVRQPQRRLNPPMMDVVKKEVLKLLHLVEVEHRAYCTIKSFNLQMSEAGLHSKLQLQELEEIRNDAYENASIYKARTRAWHDNMISRRVFQVGEKFLLFQNRLRLFSGKLRSKWMGPYEVVRVFPHGAIEIKCLKSGKVLKVNGQRLKHYHEGIEIGEVGTLHLVDPIYED